jgi:predicted nucleic acid-binding protein
LNRYVVDTSVAIKWYLAELHWQPARRLLGASHDLIAPDFLYLELGNVLWKYVIRGELERNDAVQILTDLQQLSLRVVPATADLHQALHLAMEFGRTMYDSLYVALAIREKARMVTADRKLYNALQPTRLAAHLLWIEDVP